MSAIEQELILFFKLYLLRRGKNYINYFADAKTLIEWFDFESAYKIELQDAPIYCGNCFSYIGTCYGGTLTMNCTLCPGNNSFTCAYELQELTRHCNIKWDICLYLFIRAIEDIYRCNDVRAFQAILHR